MLTLNTRQHGGAGAKKNGLVSEVWGKKKKISSQMLNKQTVYIIFWDAAESAGGNTAN